MHRLITYYQRIQNNFARLADWTERWAETPHAILMLFLLAFVESSFFPIPPDILMITMLVANRRLKWLRCAIVATLGSIIGGIFGYAIGFWFYEALGRQIVEFYNLKDLISGIGARYAANAFWSVFAAAFTPLPYKVITISAGFFKINFYDFIYASILGRGIRFFALAYLLKLFGPGLKKVIYKYFNIFSIIFIILLIGGFIALKFIF